MEGYVLLPRLGWNGNVSFILDTGADTSLLMPLDAQRMGVDYGLFENEISTLGIGGASENFAEVGVSGLRRRCSAVLVRH